MDGLLGGRRARLTAIAIGFGVAAVVAVVLVAQPWSWADSDPAGFESATLILQNSDNDRRPAADIDEFIAAYPTKMWLPGEVPEGFHLEMATIMEGLPPPIDESAREGTTKLFAIYVGPDDAQFNFFQQGYDFIGDNQLPLAQHEVRGALAYLESFRADAGGGQNLYWSRCDQGFMSTTGLEPLTEADLIRIAESVGPAECE